MNRYQIQIILAGIGLNLVASLQAPANLPYHNVAFESYVPGLGGQSFEPFILHDGPVEQTQPFKRVSCSLANTSKVDLSCCYKPVVHRASDSAERSSKASLSLNRKILPIGKIAKCGICTEPNQQLFSLFKCNNNGQKHYNHVLCKSCYENLNSFKCPYCKAKFDLDRLEEALVCFPALSKIKFWVVKPKRLKELPKVIENVEEQLKEGFSELTKLFDVARGDGLSFVNLVSRYELIVGKICFIQAAIKVLRQFYVEKYKLEHVPDIANLSIEELNAMSFDDFLEAFQLIGEQNVTPKLVFLKQLKKAFKFLLVKVELRVVKFPNNPTYRFNYFSELGTTLKVKLEETFNYKNIYQIANFEKNLLTQIFRPHDCVKYLDFELWQEEKLKSDCKRVILFLNPCVQNSNIRTNSNLWLRPLGLFIQLCKVVNAYQLRISEPRLTAMFTINDQEYTREQLIPYFLDQLQVLGGGQWQNVISDEFVSKICEDLEIDSAQFNLWLAPLL